MKPPYLLPIRYITYILTWLFFIGILQGVAQISTNTQSGDEPDWYIAFHYPEVIGALQSIAPAQNGSIWAGVYGSPATKGVLFQFTPDGESHRLDFPGAGERSHILDSTVNNQLWICSFSPFITDTYEGLPIYRLKNGRWRETRVSPGIWPQTMDMISENEGWIAGNHGLFLHYKDNQWKVETLDVPAEDREMLTIRTLKMYDSEKGWAAGERGLIAQYANGRWQKLDTPSDFPIINKIDITENGSCWFVGNKGFTARFEQSEWRVFETPTTHQLNGLEMLSPKNGWAVGQSGIILKFDGASWRQVPSPTKASLLDIHMTSEDTGWISGVDVVLRSRAIRGPMPRFKDVSHVNERMNQKGGQSAAIDFDNDGKLDLAFIHDKSLHIYKNRGGSVFEDATSSSGLTPYRYNAKMMAWGDLNGDDALDSFVLNTPPDPNQIFINNGAGGFLVKEDSPPDGMAFGSQTTAIDLNIDGNLDLFIYLHFGNDGNYLKDMWYRNQGKAHFERRQLPFGDVDGGFNVLWGDLDGDTDLDVILPGGTETKVYLNDGDQQFRDITETAGLTKVRGSGVSFQGNLFDADIDGDLDLLLFGRRLYLFLNDGNARFTLDEANIPVVETENGFLSPASNFGDIDHDGFPEFTVQPVVDGEHRLMLFKRNTSGQYENIAPKLGLNLTNCGNVLFADLDQDGDLDLYITKLNSFYRQPGITRNYHWENLQNDGNYLKIRPHGVKANTKAIGAAVMVYQAGHLQEREYLRGCQQVGVGVNLSGIYNISELHFGLADSFTYDVLVIFPGGAKVVVRDVQPGQTLDIYELPTWIRHATQLYRFLSRSSPLEILKILVVLLLTLAGAIKLDPMSKIPKKAGRLLTWLILLAGYTALSILLPATPPLMGWTPVIALISLIGLGIWLQKRIRFYRAAHCIGPYRLEKKLGEGGMGVVYKARHLLSKQVVSLKVLPPNLIEKETNKQRFLKEAKLMASLNHPNIVACADSGDSACHGYIAMEYLQGETLAQMISADKALHPKTALAILKVVCEALCYIHGKGIIHRDLKAANIYITKHAIKPVRTPKADHGALDWSTRVKLLDFGLSKSADCTTITRAATLMGTWAYMSPELLRNEKADAKSDIYALGVLLYEMLTSQRPYEGESIPAILAAMNHQPAPIRDINPEVGPELEYLVRWLLARPPNARPESTAMVLEFIRTLETCDQSACRSDPGLNHQFLTEFSKTPIPEPVLNNFDTRAHLPMESCLNRSTTQNRKPQFREPNNSGSNGWHLDQFTKQWESHYAKAVAQRESGHLESAYQHGIRALRLLKETLDQFSDEKKVQTYLKKYDATKVLGFLNDLEENNGAESRQSPNLNIPTRDGEFNEAQ